MGRQAGQGALLSLAGESEKLARSWQRHEADWLRDYLVAGVEDPRLNLQSILARHFLITALTGERFRGLMHAEYRFSAALNWLASLAPKLAAEEDLKAVLHALQHGADDAEGLAIPRYILPLFARLPEQSSGLIIPNYFERWLLCSRFESGALRPDADTLDTFLRLWREALAPLGSSEAASSNKPLKVLELACGSANDYRFIAAAGIARFLDYTGIDISEKNVANARALFPDVDFRVGNAFSPPASNEDYELSFVQDLFEHLSPEGLELSVREVCRVTKRSICAGFFSMDDIPEHIIRPLDDYHWNTLSRNRVCELFARLGFQAQVVHIGSFLREETGSSETYNHNAWTLFLLRQGK